MYFKDRISVINAAVYNYIVYGNIYIQSSIMGQNWTFPVLQMALDAAGNRWKQKATDGGIESNHWGNHVWQTWHCCENTVFSLGQLAPPHPLTDVDCQVSWCPSVFNSMIRGSQFLLWTVAPRSLRAEPQRQQRAGVLGGSKNTGICQILFT